mgnify:CR=1 FL=1
MSNPNPKRFRLIRHAAEKALPGMPSTRRPAWWEVIDRIGYAGEDTDTLGFVREGFAKKSEAVKYMNARNNCKREPKSTSVLTLE